MVEKQRAKSQAAIHVTWRVEKFGAAERQSMWELPCAVGAEWRRSAFWKARRRRRGFFHHHHAVPPSGGHHVLFPARTLGIAWNSLLHSVLGVVAIAAGCACARRWVDL